MNRPAPIPLMEIIEPLGSRTFTADDLPISIGGIGAAIAVPGIDEGLIVALIGTHEGQWFLQPTDDRSVQSHGRGMNSSVWLAAGMRFEFSQATLIVLPGEPLRLSLMHDLDNRTAPPDIVDARAPDGGGDEGVTLAPRPYTPAAPAAPAGRQRTLRAVTAALLVSLAAIAVTAFVLGSRAVGVHVRTNPEGAAVSVERAVSIGERYWMLPGKHRFQASKQGFQPAAADLDIGSQSSTTVRLVLISLPKQVHLATVPAGAEIHWDDTLLSSESITLSAGKHRLRIDAPRYDPYESNIEVGSGGGTQTVIPQLIPRFAKVKFSTDPAGAGVRVDGVLRASTPATLELDAGLRQVALESPAAKTWRGSLLVRGGVEQTVGPVRLSAADAQLAVASIPAGADVSVAGIYRGRTPLRVALAPGLEYEVAIQRAGFEPQTRRADLRTASAARVDVKLAAILGEVTVAGEPTDAVVFADGVQIGASGQTFRLPAAAVQLEVRKSGFDAYRTSVTPKPGYPQALSFQLASAGAKAAPAQPRAMQSSIGLQMKLMPTGEFEMGSERREPGRRSNEVQRRVKLVRPFYVSTSEVSNAQFRRFRAAFAAGIFRGKTLDLDNQPAVNLSWNDAVEFCNWLSTQESLTPAYVKADATWKLAAPVGSGYRLPTEAEWEFVARYDGHSATLRYPWGVSLPILDASGNYADRSAAAVLQAVLPDYNDGYAVSAPPGKFSASLVGLFDVGGNVSEWVNDLYTAAPGDPDAVSVDPSGPEQGKTHVVRGASFRTATLAELRLAYRDAGAEPRVDLGFRVARYAP